MKVFVLVLALACAVASEETTKVKKDVVLGVHPFAYNNFGYNYGYPYNFVQPLAKAVDAKVSTVAVPSTYAYGAYPYGAYPYAYGAYPYGAYPYSYGAYGAYPYNYGYYGYPFAYGVAKAEEKKE